MIHEKKFFGLKGQLYCWVKPKEGCNLIFDDFDNSRKILIWFLL